MGYVMDHQQIPNQHQQLNKACLNCPRCNSTNTKFCYYNNYSLSQPRHFCKACKRYWTRGGTLRNVPVGGGCRKNNKRVKRPNTSAPNPPPPSSSNQVSQMVTGPNNSLLTPLFYGLAGVNSGNEGLIQQQRCSYSDMNNVTMNNEITDPFLADYSNNINHISMLLPPSSISLQVKGAGDAAGQDTSNQEGQLTQRVFPFEQQQQPEQVDPQAQRWNSNHDRPHITDLGHSNSFMYWTGEMNVDVASSWPPI